MRFKTTKILVAGKTPKRQQQQQQQLSIIHVDHRVGRQAKDGIGTRGPLARFVPAVDTSVGRTAGRHADAVHISTVSQLYPGQSLQVHCCDWHALGGLYFLRPGGQAGRPGRVLSDAPLAHACLWTVCRDLYLDWRHEFERGDGPVRSVYYRRGYRGPHSGNGKHEDDAHDPPRIPKFIEETADVQIERLANSF